MKVKQKSILAVTLSAALILGLTGSPIGAVAADETTEKFEVSVTGQQAEQETGESEYATEDAENQNSDEEKGNTISKEDNITTFSTEESDEESEDVSVLFAGGDGTEESPYQVATAEQLDAVRNDLSANYIQVADIDMSGVSWVTIETFNGTFDGNGYKIDNLTLNEDSSLKEEYYTYSGLFAMNDGSLINIVLQNCFFIFAISDYHNTNYYGGIAGHNNGTISNCSVSGVMQIYDYVEGGLYNYVGGIAGVSAGSCVNCVNTMDITYTLLDDDPDRIYYYYVGGILGLGSLENDINYGNIYVDVFGFLRAGGIVGKGSAQNSVNYGDIYADLIGLKAVGGDGHNCVAGGIAGIIQEELENCINYGNITGVANFSSAYAAAFCGGIAGIGNNSETSSLAYCYNLGESITTIMTGDKHGDGGAGRVISGTTTGGSSRPTISECYSIDTTTVNGLAIGESYTGSTTLHGASMTEAEINVAIASILESLGLEAESGSGDEDFSVYFSFNNEKYVLVNEETAYIGGNIYVTGTDVDVDTELYAMTAESSDPSIAEVEFNPDGFISSVNGKSASAFYAFIITPHKPGMITITLTASNGKTFEKELYVEPELVLNGCSGSIINQSQVQCTVTLDEADAEYLEDYISHLTFKLEADKTGPYVSEEFYEVSEDGRSATYTWTISVKDEDSGTVTVISQAGQEVSENVSFKASDNQLRFTSRDVETDMLVEYSDTYYEQSSYVYNHDLAWLSLCLELSSFTATSEQESWGETDENSAKARYANIAESYEKMGFKSANYYNYDKSLNNTSDQVAYSIASKTLSSGETVVAVVIRGGGYGSEWSSNFNVGSGSNYHEGFNSAATEVYESVLDYISGINGNVKLWITGYSRGAATANLLAAKIDDNAASSDQYDVEDVFAYTFATPQGVTTNQNTSASLYENIFNIVNPGDVVPAVALSGWGFTRYGVTKYFNINASDSVFSKVESTFSTYSGETFDAENNINQHAAVSALTDIILKEYPSASSASSLLNVVQEILEYTNTKVENDGEWENISAKDYYDTLSLKYGSVKFTTALTKTNEYVTDKPNLLMTSILAMLGTDTTETITLFFLCCELNDISCDETYDLLMNILGTTVTTSALFYLLNYLPDGVSGIGVAHYPSVYLAWMSLDEENTFIAGNTDNINRGTTILSFACPVDVTVYGSDGEEIAVVAAHEIVEADVPVVVEDDVTTIYLPEGEEYSVKITATDTGTMNYTVTELDLEQNTVNRLNYYGIELFTDRVFTGSVNTSTDYTDGKYDLSYIDDNGVETTIPSDERLTENVDVSLDTNIVGYGTVSGASIYRKGDTAVLKAYADDNYHFAGWYLGENLISTEEITSVCVVEDTIITCVFEACTYEYQDNGDGTHTSTCITCNENYVEEHQYTNGVCVLCGAEQSDINTSNDTLMVRRGNTFYFNYTLEGGDADYVIAAGDSGDQVLVGDWDGDGIDGICLRRGNTCYFINDFKTMGVYLTVSYGRENDEVLVGDWDGDGKDSLAMRRNGNVYYFCNDITNPDDDTWRSTYGRVNDEILVGDWNGNGYDSLGSRRNGNIYYLSLTMVTEPDGGVWRTNFGREADEVLVGDWDGDGIDTLAMRRNGNVYYISNSISDPNADIYRFTYGRSTDEVYVGKWK